MSDFSFEVKSNSVNLLVREYVQKKLTFDRMLSEKNSRNSKSVEDSSEVTIDGIKRPSLKEFLELFQNKMNENNDIYRQNKS